MGGKGVYYLHDLMKSIVSQSYKSYEILITDHSQNNNIEQYLVNTYKDSGIRIGYYRHNYKRGNSSANVNMAIKAAKGEIIKPMFQDDVFSTKDSLLKIVSAYNMNPTWGAVGFNHISAEGQMYIGEKHKPQYPIYTEDILEGVNKFGCPSVIHFKNDNNLFDEELIWLMDCEFYYRLYKKYGNPQILNDYLVNVRIWEKSVSQQVKDNESITKKEELYVLEKHKDYTPKKEEEHEQDSNIDLAMRG
jgi:glycosyltransferase involved in cell wall biosynthesis